MATYPNAALAYPSAPERVDTLIIDEGTNFSVRARDMSTGSPRRFALFHQSMTQTQWDALEAFYDANRVAVFDFTAPWNGVTYQCVFEQGPKTTLASRGRYNVNTVLRLA